VRRLRVGKVREDTVMRVFQKVGESCKARIAVTPNSGLTYFTFLVAGKNLTSARSSVEYRASQF
jgi:hypothetical protein